MAVIQISKMQVRRGQTAQTGFPQLASGEFGWSIDTQELYIGNGAVSEGAPAVGNTQIITEHNVANFFLVAENYQYPSETAIFRSIENKLNDFVSVNDFGILNTSTDQTIFIQNAIDYAASIGKPLYFPEGEYAVNGTVYIPPRLELRGAGSQKTIITNLSTATTLQTKSFTLSTATITFGNGMQADDAQPKNIRINGFTFINGNPNSEPILRLDCTKDSVVEHCEFIGDISVNTASSVLSKGIVLRDLVNYPGNSTDYLTIRNCVFYKLSSAISCDYDTANIIISQNKFKVLDEGVVFGKNLTGAVSQQYGPQHVRITENIFETINKQAIYAGSTNTFVISDINSIDNHFYDVGNNSQGDTTSTQATEVIYFGAIGNYSAGDTFERLHRLNRNNQYWSGSANVKPTILGPANIQVKSPLVFEIPGSGSGIPMFAYPRSTYQYGSTNLNQTLEIEYTIMKPTIGMVRKGKFVVTTNNTGVIYNDNFTSNDDDEGDNVAFSAQVVSSKNLIIVYISNQSIYNGSIIYTYNVRQ